VARVLEQLLTDRFALYAGDCMEVMPTLPEASIDLSVYSPPFAGLYQYSSSERDLSNSQSLNTEYGLGYEDECLAISLAYRRKYTSDRTLGVPPSTSVILRFSLKTGDSPIQPFSLFPRDVFALAHP